jgi:hypothetical protein
VPAASRESSVGRWTRAMMSARRQRRGGGGTARLPPVLCMGQWHSWHSCRFAPASHQAFINEAQVDASFGLVWADIVRVVAPGVTSSPPFAGWPAKDELEKHDEPRAAQALYEGRPARHSSQGSPSFPCAGAPFHAEPALCTAPVARHASTARAGAYIAACSRDIKPAGRGSLAPRPKLAPERPLRDAQVKFDVAAWRAGWRCCSWLSAPSPRRRRRSPRSP